MFPVPLESLSPIRQKVAIFIESKPVVRIIISLILLNAITLGLETDRIISAEYGRLLKWVDTSLLIVFTVEILLKLFAYQLHFFRSGWNVFDFLIVSIAWIPASRDMLCMAGYLISKMCQTRSNVVEGIAFRLSMLTLTTTSHMYLRIRPLGRVTL